MSVESSEIISKDLDVGNGEQEMGRLFTVFELRSNIAALLFFFNSLIYHSMRMPHYPVMGHATPLATATT